MKTLLHIFTKYKLWLLAFFKPLGAWGLCCLALVDAAAIPIPQDLIIAAYIWADKKHFYLYVILSALGSSLGGLVPYLVGRGGGELFLMKRINRQKYIKLRDRFERQEFLAIMIPSILPPPFPWKIFVFGAGVFEMKMVNFMLAVFTGRTLRNLITAVLTIEYGPKIVSGINDLATRHRTAVLLVLFALIGLAAAWVLHRRYRKRGGDSEIEDQVSKIFRP